MDTITLQITLDRELKENAEKLYDNLGLDLTNAIRMFLKKSLRENDIPFDIKLKPKKGRPELWDVFMELRRQAQENGVIGMSLDEINDEIAAAREERRAKKGMQG